MCECVGMCAWWPFSTAICWLCLLKHICRPLGADFDRANSKKWLSATVCHCLSAWQLFIFSFTYFSYRFRNVNIHFIFCHIRFSVCASFSSFVVQQKEFFPSLLALSFHVAVKWGGSHFNFLPWRDGFLLQKGVPSLFVSVSSWFAICPLSVSEEHHHKLPSNCLSLLFSFFCLAATMTVSKFIFLFFTLTYFQCTVCRLDTQKKVHLSEANELWARCQTATWHDNLIIKF